MLEWEKENIFIVDRIRRLVVKPEWKTSDICGSSDKIT